MVRAASASTRLRSTSRRRCCARAPRTDGLACGACAGCRYAIAGQHPDLMRLELLAIDPEEDTLRTRRVRSRIDRVRALIEFVQLTSHRQRAKVAVIAPAERMNAAAANALLKTLEEPPPGHLSHPRVGRSRAGCRRRCARAAACSRRRCPSGREARAWLAAAGRRAPDLALAQAAGAPLAALAHRRSGRPGRTPRLARRARRARTAVRVGTLAARIDAGGKDERQARLAHALEWLIAWTADLARVAAGDAARQNPDAAAPLAAAGRSGGARRAVSLSSVAAAAASDAWRIRCSRASSPRRCCSITGPCSDDGGQQTDQCRARCRDGGGRCARPGVLSLNIRERAALYAAYMPFLQGRRHLHPDVAPVPARRGSLHAALADGRSRIGSPCRARSSGSLPKASRATGRRASASSSRRTKPAPPRASTIEQILGETLGSIRPTHTM